MPPFLHEHIVEPRIHVYGTDSQNTCIRLPSLHVWLPISTDIGLRSVMTQCRQLQMQTSWFLLIQGHCSSMTMNKLTKWMSFVNSALFWCTVCSQRGTEVVDLLYPHFIHIYCYPVKTGSLVSFLILQTNSGSPLLLIQLCGSFAAWSRTNLRIA